MGKFNYNEAPANDPIRIEQVFAEKPGGGVVHVTEDMPATTPVVANEDGTFTKPYEVKSFKYGTGYDGSSFLTIVKELAGEIKQGDFVTFNVDGAIAVKLGTITQETDSITIFETSVAICERFQTSNDRIIYKVAPAKGQGFYEDPIFEYHPVYITGNDLKAADGEYQPVRLINGANVRKETAVITEEQAEKMTGIHLV